MASKRHRNKVQQTRSMGQHLLATAPDFKLPRENIWPPCGKRPVTAQKYACSGRTSRLPALSAAIASATAAAPASVV